MINLKNKINNMIKCKKCGSSNVKVDFDTAYTSFPLKYGYKCQDCGEMDYISYEELLKNLGVGNSFPNNKNVNHSEEIKGSLTGWVCPKCGRCYSPFTSMCTYCSNSDNPITWKVTC